MNNETISYKLTQYSKGAGCGCKIAPSVLQEIVQHASVAEAFPQLLVGNEHSDDAAVMELDNGTALISTTDFFMPIVDDAFAFGKIASANAISDVYAMGGKPILAIAILGWPISKLPASVAQQVLQGAREICTQANIPLAGGHTIESEEPFFGLSVNGIVQKENLKTNAGAQIGDVLFITKPIGVGILSTAQKRGLISAEHEEIMLQQMCTLNSVGMELANLQGVHAITDVTGFGIIGHLIELCEASNCSAAIDYTSIPKLEEALHYQQKGEVPDATYRNWNAYNAKISIAPTVNMMEAFTLLPDPQTNGGLLISVAEENAAAVIQLLEKHSISYTTSIGKIIERTEKIVMVQ
jgi:selenide, water dikinase